MALLQLVCQSAKFQNANSVEYSNDIMEGNRFYMSGKGDLNIPLFLEIKMKLSMELDEFYKEVKDCSVILSNSGDILYDLSLEFVCGLYPIKNIKNSFIIKLPFDIFIGHISLISSYFSNITLYLKHNSDKIKEISVINENVYLDSPQRRTLASNVLFQKILTINDISNKNITQPTEFYKIKNDNCDHAIGYFILSDKVINDIEININNQVKSIHDCFIISDKLIYYSPYNINYNDKKSFLINLWEKENILIFTIKNNSNIKIFSCNEQIISYESGFLRNYFSTTEEPFLKEILHVICALKFHKHHIF